MTRKKKIEESEEAENQRALDEVAGVAEVRRSSLAPAPITRPSNAKPLLKSDTKEKRLYTIACTGTPIGNEFFDEFPDTPEILTLALSISVRLLIVAICNSELAPTQRISAMRLVAALNGKQLPATEDEPSFKGSSPLAIPTGSKEDVTRTLEAIRRVSGSSLG